MSETALVPYGRQAIDEDDVEAVARVLRGDWLTQGPAVAEFERALCAAFGARGALAVNSGTAALHAGMLALGIGPGDLVIVPPITFVASANAALYCGAEVAFVDVEPDTGLLSVDGLEEFLAGYRGPLRPRAVVAVHYAGLPCDMVRLGEVCARYGLELIEDACHSPGATWTDAGGQVRVVGDGTASAFTALSFHPVKHVTTAEGGAVMSSRPDVLERAALFRTHGITRDPKLLRANDGPWWYEQHELGFNYRMPDVLAALGTSQLRKHARWLEHRRAVARQYREALTDVPGIALQAERVGRAHAYHLFPVLAEQRDELFAELVARGIRPQVHYIPVHQQPYYVRRYGAQHFPAAEAWYRREISIPMHQGLTAADVERVCESLGALGATR